jgi:hypothetical protein
MSIPPINTLPPILRHLLLLLAMVLLTWGATDLVPWLQGQPGYGALLAGLVAALLGYFTPLIQSYGVTGKRSTRNRTY